MKTNLKQTIIATAVIITMAGLVGATVTTTGDFPHRLNSFSDNDIINAGDWNLIESDLGTHIGNVATGTPQTINWIIRNGSFATTSIKIGTIATTTISGDNGGSILSTTTVQGYFNTGILTATSSITTNNLTVNGTCTGCGGLAYLFTPTSNLGQIMSATTSSLFINGDSTKGFYANGSSILSTTTVQGYFNTGILTSTSTGNYLGDLSLGVKLPNAQLANSTISGIALGSNLANLTATNGTLTFSVTYNGSAAATIGLNLNSDNLWTASTTIPLLNTGVITATSSISVKNLTATASSTFAGFFNNGQATTSGNFAIINGQVFNPYASTTASTNQIVNWNLGNIQRFILSANTNFDINSTSSNPRSGAGYILKICQDSTGGRVVNFGTGLLRWFGGNSATTTVVTTANYCTHIGMLYDDRVNLYDVMASSTAGISQ